MNPVFHPHLVNGLWGDPVLYIGFDHLLRVCLGREKTLFLYSPPRFIDQLESKLRAYSWNLLAN